MKKELEKQLESNDESLRKSAEDCLIIAGKLKEIGNGHIWDSQWKVLVKTMWVGKGLDAKRYYVPSEIGRIFLEGLRREQVVTDKS